MLKKEKIAICAASKLSTNVMIVEYRTFLKMSRQSNVGRGFGRGLDASLVIPGITWTHISCIKPQLLLTKFIYKILTFLLNKCLFLILTNIDFLKKYD